MRDFGDQHGLQSVCFDGCAFGLKSRFGSSMGQPIRKPWRVVTNCAPLLLHLNRSCVCREDHAPCAGRDTKVTEGYTEEMAHIIHAGFRFWCRLAGKKGGGLLPSAALSLGSQLRGASATASSHTVALAECAVAVASSTMAERPDEDMPDTAEAEVSGGSVPGPTPDTGGDGGDTLPVL